MGRERADYKGAWGTFRGATEIFYVLILVVVTYLCVFVKTHRIVYPFRWILLYINLVLGFPAVSLFDSAVKNMPANAETRVRTLNRENPLGKEMATHSYSCLGNPMDRGAWQATVFGVAKSWRQLSDYTTTNLTLTASVTWNRSFKSESSKPSFRGHVPSPISPTLLLWQERTTIHSLAHFLLVIFPPPLLPHIYFFF